jgi:hypothetical protein
MRTGFKHQQHQQHQQHQHLSMNTTRCYRSAVSYALLIPLAISLSIALFLGIYTGEFIAVGIVLATIMGLVLPMLLNTTYTIDGAVLKIRSGFIKFKDVPIAGITRIEKTQTLLSAPAISLTERIEIFYNRYDSVVISPQNRSGFIADVLSINPAVVVDKAVRD